jgi:hypothetical protein
VDRTLHRVAERDAEAEGSTGKEPKGTGTYGPNAFPHRSKSLSDQLERSGGRSKDVLVPNPEQLKRADTEPVDRRHSGVARSSETLPTYERGRQKGSGGSSGGVVSRSDVARPVVGSDGDFECIEVFVDENELEDIEDGWEEITDGSSDDYGYFEARLRTKGLSPPMPKSVKSENDALSPRSVAAAEAKASALSHYGGSDQMTAEWVIDPRDLQLSDRVLGKGFFGEVKKGTCCAASLACSRDESCWLIFCRSLARTLQVGGEGRLLR